MLKPTQDEKLKKEIINIIKDSRCYILSTCDKCEANNTKYCSAWAIMDSVILYLENSGYHVGLPPSIEEALNSGDGTYRP